MPALPIGAMASVHCAAATENFLACENHSLDVPWWQDLVEGIEKPIINKGFITVPDKPGLGITLNEDVVKQHLAPDTDSSSPRRSGTRNAPATGCGAWRRRVPVDRGRWWVVGDGWWPALMLLPLSLAVFAAQPDTRQVFEKGQRAMEAGDLMTAEKDFRAVLTREPNNVGAHGNLAVVYMRRKEWKPALQELQAAERLAPTMPGIRLNIGLVYYKQADYKHAIQPFASVLRDQPDSAQARYLLGLCDFFTEHYADAAQTLEPLWTEQSGNLNYLYVLSISANKSGRTELDQRATTRLIEVGQNSAEFHLILGKAHLAQELYPEALDEFSQAVRLNPKLPFVHYFLGAVYRRQNELDAAKREYLKDIEIEPDVPYNYDALGAVCYALEQIPEAERYFKQALRLDPRQAASSYGLAKIHKQQGHYAAALEELRAAGELTPIAPVLLSARTDLLAMGRAAGSEDRVRKSCQLAPSYPRRVGAPNERPAPVDAATGAQQDQQ